MQGLLDRALAFDKERRYAGAGAMKEALDAVLAGLKGSPVLGATLGTAPAPASKARRGWALGVGLAILASGALGVRLMRPSPVATVPAVSADPVVVASAASAAPVVSAVVDVSPAVSSAATTIAVPERSPKRAPTPVRSHAHPTAIASAPPPPAPPPVPSPPRVDAPLDPLGPRN